MRRNFLLSPVLALVAFASLQADDQIRSAQEALKSQGFYNGTVDGEMSADTKGAIKRFQIRSGLDATGELNQETNDALRKGEDADQRSGAAAAPTPITSERAVPPPSAPYVPPSVDANDPNYLRSEPSASRHTAPPSVPRSAPSGIDGVSRPNGPAGPGRAGGGMPSAASDPDYAELYIHTPYQNAPAQVQHDTLRRAQTILLKRGFYHDDVTGRPGHATEKALFRFQASQHLPETGILDIDTLAALRLLPVARVLKPTMHPGGMRVPVRGIPVD